MTTRPLALLLVAGLLVAPGCITFYGEETVDVHVLVTRDVGTDVLVDEEIQLPEGASAMDALHDVARVETSHGGGFIEAIEGIESRYPDAKVDWFYHVDTRLSPVGAGEHEVHDGELVVFDHRSWERTMHLPHLLTGLDAWPVDLEQPRFDRATFEQVQSDEHTRATLYAHVDGSQLTLLDAHGEPARTLDPPWLLAHAVAGEDGDPRILLVPSDEDARAFVTELDESSPVGVGLAITPNATYEVPAG